jgi:hypothetical protein
MTRLRDEIVSSRHARVALQGDVVRLTGERRTRVSAVCAGFARDRAGAHRAWFGPALSERQRADRQPPAKPVPAPAARPPVAPLPQAQGTPCKGPKKH